MDIASLAAYETLVSSGELNSIQERVLNIFITENRPLSADEVKALYVTRFGARSNKSENLTLRNRISELTIVKLLRKSSEKSRSPITQRMVSTWEWTGETTPAEPDAVYECPHCKGAGEIARASGPDAG
jgi:hypothetical protein